MARVLEPLHLNQHPDKKREVVLAYTAEMPPSPFTRPKRFSTIFTNVFEQNERKKETKERNKKIWMCGNHDTMEVSRLMIGNLEIQQFRLN